VTTERFTSAVEWKSIGAEGELEGYASVFGNIDEGGDVVERGAFKKTLADRRQSGQPWPLTTDHDLSVDGIVGSITYAEEDAYGLKVRAKFSGIERAQDVRRRMVEGHLRGLSFSYQVVRSRVGTLAGKAVRYLAEVRLFEVAATAYPMNQLALASAKSGPGVADLADVDRQLRELEAWQHRVTLEQAVGGMIEHPASARHALDLLEATQLAQRQRELEAWLSAQPPAPSDSERADARRRADWERRNNDSNTLAAVMERIERTACGHRGCPPGRCHYRR
jgi:HK97 family phage prohead protease